jgi:hypothetical protein
MTCRCNKHFCYKCGGIYGSCECVRLRNEELARFHERRRLALIASRARAAAKRRLTIQRKKLESELAKTREAK